jgi:hypothetical protein
MTSKDMTAFVELKRQVLTVTLYRQSVGAGDRN